MRNSTFGLAILLGGGLLSAALAQTGYREPRAANQNYRAEAVQTEQELRRLQGVWTFEGTEQGGFINQEPGRVDQFIIEGNRWRRVDRGQLLAAGTLEIVELGPRFSYVNQTVTQGPDRGQRYHAILRIDGDRLQWCYGPPGTAAPQRLETRNDFGITNTSWRRIRR